MSSTLGMVSIFALSTLLLSPLAQAEESEAFAAKNAARAAAVQQNQAELSTKGNAQQHTSASQAKSDSAQDS